MEFKKFKLKKVIDFNPRETIKKHRISKKVSMVMLVPFYKYVTRYELSKFKGGSKFRNGDTILARITPCLENGKTAFVNFLEENEVGFGSTEFIVMRSKSNKTLPEFVYYLAISSEFRDKAISLMTGTSGRQRIQLDALSEYCMKIPPLKIQQKIVRILSSLDKKIELNNKINENLEKLSSELYKRWFVDFEFPDEEGRPYKSSGGKMTYNKELGMEIPEGWGVGWFDDGVLTKVIKSGINKFSGFKKYVATADVDGANIKKSTEVSYEDKPSRANMQPLINSVWIAKMQGSVKNVFVAEYMEEYLNNYIFSTGFLGLECLNGSIDYIWNIINSDKFILEKNNLSTGTLMAGINNSTIRNFKYIIPDNKTLRDYGDFTYYINRSIYLYNKNNNLLKEIRDNLIPKLLNGELDLDNIEI